MNKRIRPVLFKTEMVRAILDGRKTVTRRVAKKIPTETHWIEPVQPFSDIKFECHWGGNMPDVSGFKDGMAVVEPPYQPGDILYVRETWEFLPCIECMGEGDCNKEPCTYEDKDSVSEGCFVYRADHPHPGRVNWSPSIHMPKEAARIWLRVTDVSVERICNMLQTDFLDEGIELYKNDGRTEKTEIEIEYEFEDLWNATIKEPERDLYGWDANPWVWVIKFEQCEKP